MVMTIVNTAKTQKMSASFTNPTTRNLNTEKYKCFLHILILGLPDSKMFALSG